MGDPQDPGEVESQPDQPIHLTQGPTLGSRRPSASTEPGARPGWANRHSLGLLIGGGAAAVLGLLFVLFEGSNVSACSSFFGQVAQSASSQMSSRCSADGIIYFVGWVLLVGGVLAGALGIYSNRRGTR